MPKSAATIFGLVLVAVSIGFNTWRYPIVWRMADESDAAAVSGESTQPSESALAAETAKTAAEPPRAAVAAVVPTLATQGTANAAPSAPEKTVAAMPAVEVKPPICAMPVAIAQHPAAMANQDKPLTPVRRAAAPEKSMGVVENAAVRRLPPVDGNVAVFAGGALPQSPGGAIPIYPGTGIK